MNARRFIFPFVVTLLGAAILLLFLRNSPQRESQNDSKKTAKKILTAPIHNTAKFPPDNRSEVQTLYQFAKVANLYNFDPKIIAFLTNDNPSLIDIGTPTHGVSFFGRGKIRGKLHLVASNYDGSDDRAKPDVAKQWYQCTGTWTEVEAVAATYEILLKMGETNLVNELKGFNEHEFENYEYNVETPDGRKITVTPFPRVTLYKGGNVSVRAEFRMGTNGPVGLTRWFCLY